MNIFKINTNNKAGFSLAELMIASLILMIVLTGMLVAFVKIMELNELSRNMSIAVSASKSRMELIRNTPKAQLSATYNGVTFTDNRLNGTGVSYVDETDPDLTQIIVSFSWRQKGGRIIGEDLNLSGAVNAGEDTNGNGILDSPVMLRTYIY